MQIEEETKIDLNLYSRQIGAFGVETMTKLVKLRVLIMGMSGLGLETSKNLILSGPKSVKIWDNRVCLDSDVEFNYYLKKENVEQKLTRAQALKNNLANLNSYVDVDILDLSNLNEILSENVLENFDLVIVTDVYPLEKMQELNSLLRNKNKGFICAATIGLLGFSFTDFVQHKVFDKNGEPKKHVLVTSIDSEGIVTTEEKKRHDLENGDIVKFSEIVGMEQMNGMEFKVIDVITPFSFKIDFEGKNHGKYIRNGTVEQVKQIIYMKFDSLQNVLEKPHMTMIDCDMDFMNMDKVFQFKILLRTLWRYISQNGVPNFFNLEQMNSFLANLRVELEKDIVQHEEFLNKDKKPEEKVSKKDWLKILDTNLPKLVFSLAKGTFAPVCSFFGGIIAQEAVKFTGKFTPINQLFIHEFYTGLFKEINFEDVLKNKNDVEKNSGSRYLSQIALLGSDLQKKLSTSKVFMIGAGALGCEYLKLFSMMGISCSPEGQFIVTDDDTIEVSNLNRQFLFRKTHVGKSKSLTASNVVKKFNPEFNVLSKENRASLKTENVFTDTFWDSLSFVVNAVDNVKARTYVDQKSVFHNKMLFESGTLGTKCNSQLIIPKLTECYSDSQDPPEKSVPMCTMRSFPYLINHCIEWARVKFFELFVNSSTFLSEFYQDVEKGEKDVLRRMKDDMSELKQIVEYIPYYLDLMKKNTLKEYVKLALFFYQHFFDAEIAKLLALFPADYKDKDGNLFWTSPKRPPVNLPFDKSNEEHMNFIITAVQLLTQVFPPQEKFTNKDVEALVSSMKIKREKLEVNEGDRKKLTNENADNEKEESDQDNVLNLIKQLKECLNINKNLTIKEVEFEKDDDSNGHIDFMTFFSNFRALNYEIAVAPRHKIKLIAGKIIPAIATATAMVCGAVGIEIYKYLLDVNIEQRRNFFSNLAVPIFSFSEPIPPVVQKDKDYDVILMGPVVTIPKNWNTWSKIEIKGPLTLQQVIDEIKKEYGFVVSSFVCNSIQVWCSYMNCKNERLNMKMEDILVDIGFGPFEGKKYQDFSISGETDDMIDVYCPMLKYHLG